jgi:RNA polymerase sigma-70 factor (ECF subfamily)
MNAHQTSPAEASEALSSAANASEWLNEHGDALYRYARSRVGHRELAEDLVQDALLAALQSRERFQGTATVRTWLLAILRHKIVDHYRRASGPARAPESQPIAAQGPVRARYFSATGLWKTALATWKAPDKALEDREFWDVLDGCLGRLPRSLSSVFILRELEEQDTTELRRVLNLSEVNLRVRLHRARLLLRECLEKHWFVEEPDDGPRRTP